MTAVRSGDDTSTDPAQQASAGAEPFYLPVGDEVEVFRAAYARRIPVLLKGPTGCGKTRFVEYMAWLLGREEGRRAGEGAVVTVSCHDDLTSADLVGRYLLSGQGTVWLDGPLTRAVREGAICYLDEVVEARKDTTVILHALTDHRRMLPVERLGTTVAAHPDFFLVVSYNPGYQAAAKDLKPSTRQRFLAIEFTYPSLASETEIITHETGLDEQTAHTMAFLGAKLRTLGEADVIEGPSTRLLLHAGSLIADGITPRRACDVGLVQALSDDPDIQEAIREVVTTVFPS
jgi:nitric oxide reductase NorQ protein